MAFNRAPVRARVGLLMRQGSNFGDMTEAEQAVRNAGLGLAPLAVSEEPISEGGVTILATAALADLDSGALRALVIPDGADADINVTEAAKRAVSAGLPVVAFGSSVPLAADAAGMTASVAPAALIAEGKVHPLDDIKALSAVAEKIS